MVLNEDEHCKRMIVPLKLISAHTQSPFPLSKGTFATLLYRKNTQNGCIAIVSGISASIRISEGGLEPFHRLGVGAFLDTKRTWEAFFFHKKSEFTLFLILELDRG